MTNFDVMRGDCRDLIQAGPAACVDAVVCDPPYGLGKEPDPLAIMRAWLDYAEHAPRGKGGFMGKAWDTAVPGPSYWMPIHRAMKPGAYLLAFGGTRTFDLLTLALRVSGFEVRDTLCWLYGSGFPKSHDVGKAIDKATGATGTYGEPKSEKHAGWIKLGQMRGDEGHDGYQRPWMQDGEAVDRNARRYEPATDLARQWDGWGTALKPAWEPIILARKPLTGTVAANVEAYGVGGLNIDGCRIAHGDDVDLTAMQRQSSLNPIQFGGAKPGDVIQMYKESGRWPANLVLDEEAAAMLDAQGGESRSVQGRRGGVGAGGYEGGPLRARDRDAGYGDVGGPSRFFYVAKASRAERNAGLADLPAKFAATMGSGIGAREHDPSEPRAYVQNTHPTVKPISLMRWLCRLITPPGGLILDPFCGSGSTGCAAVLEGFDFVGMDTDEESVEIARRRIAHWQTQR
jgi:DNA modification methylase